MAADAAKPMKPSCAKSTRNCAATSSLAFWTNAGAAGSSAAVVAGLLRVRRLCSYWQHRSARHGGRRRASSCRPRIDALAAEQAAPTREAALAELATSGAPAIARCAMFTQADIAAAEERPEGRGGQVRRGRRRHDRSAQPFRDLALIRQTTAEFDTLKPQVVVDRLRPLAVPGNRLVRQRGRDGRDRVSAA